MSELRHPTPLKAVRDDNAFGALGRAVSYMMTKPAFANAPFGHWAKTLTGQVNRKHYFIIMRGDQTVGFLGWAFVPEDIARTWVNGKGEVAFGDSKDGDSMVINAWAADDAESNAFVLDVARRVCVGRKWIFAKRFYKNGRSRPVILEANEFISGHIKRIS